MGEMVVIRVREAEEAAMARQSEAEARQEFRERVARSLERIADAQESIAADVETWLLRWTRQAEAAEGRSEVDESVRVFGAEQP